MAHLIDKDALVAEIEKWLGETDKGFPNDHNLGRYDMCKQMRSFINTLEVKEVDYRPIDKDFERDAVNFCFDNALNTTPRIAKTIAKHFFELGMQVSNKAQKGEKI